MEEALDLSFDRLLMMMMMNCTAYTPSKRSLAPLLYSIQLHTTGIATRYGLGGPGIKSRCGRDFPQPPRPALRPTQYLRNGYRVILWAKTAGAWC